MKHLYLFFSFLLLFNITNSQSYTFGIVNNGGYNFSVTATPDFDATDTDISDIGFALMLPAGNADVANLSQFNGRALSSTEVTAAQLTGLGLGDGTRDGFAINLPPGQTILSHTNGTPFIIVSFDVTNMPTSGQIEILQNSDPIAQGLGGAIDSFYNANIDNTSTQDYFGGLTAGQESFMFSTLGIDDTIEETISVSIYPNPTSEYINIKTEIEINNIELFDITGKQVLKTRRTNVINISHLQNGIYLIKIVSDKGSVIKRLVIK